MIQKIQLRIWDYLLCLLCQSGLMVHVFSGFVLQDPISQNYFLAILILAILDLVYFVFSGSKLLSVTGVAAALAVVAACFIWTETAGVYETETPNSIGITLALILLVSLLVFLLTRSKGGTIVLFLAGTLIIAGAHFLLYETKLAAFVLFEISVILLYSYRGFLIIRQEAGKGKLPIFALQTTLIALIALVLSLSVYYGLVRPLNPPTKELELITAMDERDLLWLFGMEKPKKEETPEPKEEELPEESIEEPQAETPTPEPKTTPQAPGSPPSEPESLSPTNAKKPFMNVLWIVLVVAAAFIVRYLRKKIRHDRIKRLNPKERVLAYYPLFLRLLSKIGYQKLPQQTLSEYAQTVIEKTAHFQNDGADFAKLTEVYMGAYYGSLPVSEEEAEEFRCFYDTFEKNVKTEIGFVRFCLVYFLL